MAASKYGASFPKIVIDASVNYPNAQFNIKQITAEEWNDLLHHTHKLPDIVDANGNALGTSANLDGAVSLMAFNQLQSKVLEFEERIAALEKENADLKEQIIYTISE